MKKGFTLMELMVVVAVIAILAGIAVVSFANVQKQAKDTKSKAESKSILTALMSYQIKVDAYPIQLTTPALASTALLVLEPTYMSKVPTGNYYYISSAGGAGFGLCVDLLSEGAGKMWKISSTDPSGSVATGVASSGCTP